MRSFLLSPSWLGVAGFLFEVQTKTKMTAVLSWVAFVILGSICAAETTGKLSNTENILINVTAGSLSGSDLQESNNLQISFNMSVGDEQVLINDLPMNLSGVTRFTCKALFLDSANGSSDFQSGDLVSTVTRVLVSQNRLQNESEELLALQLFSEVIEVEGKEVQQPDMCEVKLLMGPDFQKVGQYVEVYPIGRSDIFKFPRENDVVVTDPNSRRDEEPFLTQTTGQYPHTERQADTTLEEVAAPGKLPETPLRMDPDLLSYDGPDDSSSDSNQKEETPSPYSALCRWVDEARERLHRFCLESLPLFFMVMGVVVIGVAGSGFIVKVLDLFFPACDHRHVFHFNPVTLMPEEEKQTLLDNLEAAAEEEMPEEEKKP